MSIGLVTGQHNYTQQSSGTSITCQFPSDVTLGNLIVVGVSNFQNSGASTMSVSDDAGNTYIAVASAINDGNSGKQDYSQVFWAYVSHTKGGSGPTITVSGLVNNKAQVHISEFSGVVAVDQFQNATGSATTWDSGSTSTTSQANELVYGFLASSAPSSITSLSAGAGFTSIDSQIATDIGFVAEYKTVSSTGTYNATGSGSGAKGSGYLWGAWVVTFVGPLDATVTGVGADATMAAGTGTIVLKPTAVGASSPMAAGVGTLHTDQNLSGTGVSSTMAAGVGTVVLKPTSTGVSSPMQAGVGTVTASAVMTGVGAAMSPGGSCGTITGTANMAGVGASSSMAASPGTIVLKPTPAGVAAPMAASPGTIKLIASVPGPSPTSAAGVGRVLNDIHITGVGVAAIMQAGVGEVTCNSSFPMIAFLGQ